MATTLTDLPEDLLVLIAEQLRGHNGTLRSLCLVSRLFHAIADPIQYGDIFFRNARQSICLSKILSAYPRRAAAVQSIDARCLWDCPPTDNSSNLEEIPEILRLTQNIRSLTVESSSLKHDWRHSPPRHNLAPFWAALQEKLATMFWNAGQSQVIYAPASPLRQLRQLTLHWFGDGNEPWRCNGPCSTIFALPRLKHLTLFGATIHDDAIDSVAHLPKTPLKTLEIDCNISQRGLAGILSRPRALAHLRLGQNLWYEMYDRVDNSRPFPLPADLTILDGGLSDFPVLQAVTIDGWPSRGLEDMLTMPELAPSDLQSICIQGNTSISSPNNGFLDVLDFMEAVRVSDSRLANWCQATASIKTLRRVEVRFPGRDGVYDPLLTDGFFGDSMSDNLMKKVLIERVAEDLRSRGVALVVYARPWVPNRYPSHLYGGTETPFTLFYDSEQGGWVVAKASSIVAENGIAELKAQRFLERGFAANLDNPALAL